MLFGYVFVVDHGTVCGIQVQSDMNVAISFVNKMINCARNGYTLLDRAEPISMIDVVPEGGVTGWGCRRNSR